MSYEEFKTALFKKRGAMRNIDLELSKLYYRGSHNLKNIALNTKKLGIKRMAEIASSYSMQEQDDIVRYINEHPKAKKQDIETFILGL